VRGDNSKEKNKKKMLAEDQNVGKHSPTIFKPILYLHIFFGHAVVSRDESGTDMIRPTDRPKGSDTQMVRSYSNPNI
jgi:hypothetical protein